MKKLSQSALIEKQFQNNNSIRGEAQIQRNIYASTKIDKTERYSKRNCNLFSI